MHLKLSNRLFRFIAFVAINLALSSGATIQAQDTLSLHDCILYTLKHNVNSTIYKNDTRISAEKIREYRSAMLPSVNGNAGFDYNPKLQVTIIPPGAFGPEETKIEMGTMFVPAVYVEADQVILNRAYILDIKSSKVDKVIADLNVQKENEVLVCNTALAYYDVLTYQEKIKLSLENEKQGIQLQDILKLRFEQGVAKQSEYDRVRVNLKNVQSELALNHTNYQQSLNKLKNAMGMDLQTPIAITDSVNYTATIVMPEMNGFNTQELVDYQIDQQNVLQKGLDVKKKKAAYLPTLTAYGKYGANAFGSEFSNTFTSWYDYATIGLKLSVPIFNGFSKNSQLAQSKLNAENQRLTQQYNLENYKLEYQNSGTKLFSSYTSLQKDKETLELAKNILEASTVEYREGKSTYSAFLDDDYSYKQAQSNYISSLIDFLNSRLSFEKSKGTLFSYLNINK
jgi:outer membrane protein TolC